MSLVKLALIEEFKDLATKAVDYKEKINAAKTFAKKEIYKKKLKKNNIKAAEILAALEKVANAESANKAAGVDNEASGDAGRVETPSEGTTSLE